MFRSLRLVCNGSVGCSTDVGNVGAWIHVDNARSAVLIPWIVGLIGGWTPDVSLWMVSPEPDRGDELWIAWMAPPAWMRWVVGLVIESTGCWTRRMTGVS